jgi:hypothetical protein
MAKKIAPQIVTDIHLLSPPEFEKVVVGLLALWLYIGLYLVSTRINIPPIKIEARTH